MKGSLVYHCGFRIHAVLNLLNKTRTDSRCLFESVRSVKRVSLYSDDLNSKRKKLQSFYTFNNKTSLVKKEYEFTKTI